MKQNLFQGNSGGGGAWLKQIRFPIAVAIDCFYSFSFFTIKKVGEKIIKNFMVNVIKEHKKDQL